MLWPILTPFKISIIIAVIITFSLAALSPKFKWKRKKTFFISSIINFIMIIPSCTGIMYVMDSYRFGLFEYKNYEEINDFRVERFLPKESKQISLLKNANGYSAKYHISEEELKAYINNLWKKYGSKSAVKRSEMNEGEILQKQMYEYIFKNLNWDLPEQVIIYNTPRASNGAGATYYYDRKQKISYQRSAYW
jgi:hypothetical protein